MRARGMKPGPASLTLGQSQCLSFSPEGPKAPISQGVISDQSEARGPHWFWSWVHLCLSFPIINSHYQNCFLTSP